MTRTCYNKGVVKVRVELDYQDQPLWLDLRESNNRMSLYHARDLLGK